MSSKGKIHPPEYDETTLEDESLTSAQETVPVPHCAGTNLIALRWLSGALAMLAEQAPDERPSKKS